MPTQVKSHIQMPKCLLKRFEWKGHFYYYDVKNGFIGKNGHARSINTEMGYYSESIESYLNREVENPFSNMLSEIDQIDFNSKAVPVFGEHPAIKSFLYSLICRSPDYIQEIHKNSVLFQFFDTTSQHDTAVSLGMKLMTKNGYFDSFYTTFTINRSSIPFVLTMQGLFSFKFKDSIIAMLPIDPKKALTFVKEESQGNPAFHLMETSDEEVIRTFNSIASTRQVAQGYGYIVSSSREALESAIRCNLVQG